MVFGAIDDLWQSPQGEYIVVDYKATSKAEDITELIPYTGDDSWVEKALVDAHKCLNGNTIPAGKPDFDYCQYVEAICQYK